VQDGHDCEVVIGAGEDEADEEEPSLDEPVSLEDEPVSLDELVSLEDEPLADGVPDDVVVPPEDEPVSLDDDTAAFVPDADRAGSWPAAIWT
jgi:hypothetical protein